MSVKRFSFNAATESGAELSFRVEDGQCIIAQDGAEVARVSTDAMPLGRAVKRYLQLIEDCGGAAHVYGPSDQPPLASAPHPHAG
jgi:hypothetical protein